jgi:hypothetical protein
MAHALPFHARCIVKSILISSVSYAGNCARDASRCEQGDLIKQVGKIELEATSQLDLEDTYARRTLYDAIHK